MRYRALDADGDMTFGRSQGNFLINSPEAVAQAVLTRLRLMTGEWYFDLSEGTPYRTSVLGRQSALTYDAAFRDRILGTPGVREMLSYESRFDPETRNLPVRATVDTIYGETSVTVSL